ncbi:carboxypeptidase-like regulatory domain-containing protein, partial [Paludibaculum fermentans]|uniref:carboxypeptidase-like regulatory domain-containing protein n=1 Tax=Paludibaculum fermentans TaxID=1473598 RepID=UPI003EBECFE7
SDARKGGNPQPVRVLEDRTIAGLAIVLRSAPAFCVRGEVRNAAGVLRGDVALRLEAQGWSASVFNDGGRFLLTGLLPGEYRLIVTGQGVVSQELARELIRVDSSNSRVVVRLP